jgi:hypothetical protein
MHRSRLVGFVVDCQDADLKAASSFWSAALGMPSLGPDSEGYWMLDGSARDLHIEVQRVSHESRVHLDIESDDVDAEAARLERLGAVRVSKIKTWWVMQAPTGQRFCVVRAKRSLDGVPGATRWD